MTARRHHEHNEQERVPASGASPGLPASEVPRGKLSGTHAQVAIELLVEVLSGADSVLDRAGFYSRLAEVACRVGELGRAVIFRFDEATRRVEAAGSHGIDLERFAGMPMGLEMAPDAARALAEDRVIEVTHETAQPLPPAIAELVGEHTLVYVPIAAAGRWPGVIVGEPIPGAPPLDGSRRELLWTLGKTLALASMARIATFHGERAKELEARIDLAHEIHDRVVQRLFGVSMALSSPGALDDEARDRCATEVQVALEDLRTAVQRPLRRGSKPTGTTLAAELARLSTQHPELQVRVEGSVPDVPAPLEPLAQSVLAEAVRNVTKHADARSLVVRVRCSEGLFVLEVENDGVGQGPRPGPPGMGLRLAALEALGAGGLVDFGERRPGWWQVRLAVPDSDGPS
jgi:signal transduction histidine kinase